MLIKRQENTSCRRGVALRGFARLSDVFDDRGGDGERCADTSVRVEIHGRRSRVTRIFFRVPSETTDMEIRVFKQVSLRSSCSCAMSLSGHLLPGFAPQQ